MVKRDEQNSLPEVFRLNQAIAKAGLCSRRKANELVLAGRVKVNGKQVDSFALLVDPHKDVIEVDGKVISGREFVYVLLHKPKGIITTCADERGRPAILNLLPPSLGHLKPAGRLDRDSSGLLLMTNDGALIQTLTHPRKHVPKTYRVTVSGKISQRALSKLASGISLEEGMTQPAEIRLIRNDSVNSAFEIVIYEGKNRQIRRMCGSLGLSVITLMRVAIGELQLSGLESGTWRHLSSQEIIRLRHHLMPGSG